MPPPPSNTCWTCSPAASHRVDDGRGAGLPFNRAERPTAKQVVELQYSRCAVSIFGVQRPRASADGRNAASVTVSVDEIDVADPADALTRAGASSRSTTSCCCHLTYAGPSRRWPPSARTRAENGTANLADDRS